MASAIFPGSCFSPALSGVFPHRIWRARNLWVEGRSNMKEQPKKQQEDLLAQIRSQYEPELGLEGMSAAKMKDGWLLSRDPESEAGYALWEVHKDPERVRLALAWQEQVKAKGCAEVLTIRKTSQGESFIRREEGVFYLTEWVAGTPPEVDKRETLPAVARGLAALYKHNYLPVPGGQLSGQQLPGEPAPEELSLDEQAGLWLKGRQEKLTELLKPFHFWRENGATNDFERLYVENFPDLYARGQEALEKIVLAGADWGNMPVGFLLANLAAENFWQTREGIVILRTTDWQLGPLISSLALLLKMYLPLQQWNREVARETIRHYRACLPLRPSEKQYLLADLAFPSRFWLYTRQYCAGQEKAPVLAEKLKNYLYELTWQDQCLTDLEQWLWEEEEAEQEKEGREKL